MDQMKYINYLDGDKSNVEGNLIKFDEVYIKKEPFDNDNVINGNTVNIQENSRFSKREENVTFKSEIKVESQEITSLACDIKDESIAVKQYCENCKEHYDGFCIKCSMLLHILDNKIEENDIDRSKKTLPKYILSIKSNDHKERVFALKTIPKNVYFGPFDGLEAIRQEVRFMWKLNCGKFANVGSESNVNWMHYVNCAERVADRNLIILQYDGNLYYRSDREIGVGEELLIYHEEVKLNNETEQYCQPLVQKKMNDVYACTFCCLGFSTIYHLVKHKVDCPFMLSERVTEEEIMQCPFCTFYLDEKEYFDFHMNYCCERLFKLRSKAIKVDRLVNSGKYKCTRCKHETDLLDNFSKETVGHVKAFTCPVCGKKVWMKVNVKRHQKYGTCMKSEYKASTKEAVECFNGRSAADMFVCKICEKSFKSGAILKTHQVVHLEGYLFKCTQCDYKSNYKENLDMHFKNKHVGGEKRFKCSKCNYQTNYKTSLKGHSYTHGETKQFECSFCRKRFTLQNSLRRHYCTAMREKSYDCATCNRKYTNRKNLIRHIQFEHIENATKKYKCTRCTFETNYKSDLNSHVVRHVTKHPHECEECGERFSRKPDLISHGYKHRVGMLFECKRCGKKFRRNMDLARHSIVHRDERPFECENDPKTHAYTHRAGMLFECKECGKTFKRKTHLTRHYIVHSDERPFECEVCSKRFPRKQTLKRHSYLHMAEKNVKETIIINR